MFHTVRFVYYDLFGFSAIVSIYCRGASSVRGEHYTDLGLKDKFYNVFRNYVDLPKS